MKKNQIATIVIVAAFVGLLLFINRHEPQRLSELRKKEAAEAQKKVDAANDKSQPKNLGEAVKMMTKNAFANALEKANAASSSEAAVAAAPYQVEFTCSNGSFVVEVHPEWAPIGAEQFRKAVDDGVYNEGRFFRVLPGFVVQFGIPGDPEKAAAWEKKQIQDEPVKAPNARGTVTFAKSRAPNSRTTQIFINLANNVAGSDHDLDSMGFPPFGKVIKGMEVVDAIYSEYRQDPDQGEIQARGNAYLKQNYPKMDFVKEAKVLGPAPAPGAPAAPAAQAAPSAPAAPDKKPN